MNITEEQEADSVACKYKYLYDVIHTEIDAIRCAIQDRQSVLDLAKVAVQTCMDEQDEFWQNEIQSLNNQIKYLKSKL